MTNKEELKKDIERGGTQIFWNDELEEHNA